MSKSQPCVAAPAFALHYLSTSLSVSVPVGTGIVFAAREFIFAIVVLLPVGRWRTTQPEGCNIAA